MFIVFCNHSKLDYGNIELISIKNKKNYRYDPIKSCKNFNHCLTLLLKNKLNGKISLSWFINKVFF
jgi:hypothetical protein